MKAVCPLIFHLLTSRISIINSDSLIRSCWVRVAMCLLCVCAAREDEPDERGKTSHCTHVFIRLKSSTGTCTFQLHVHLISGKSAIERTSQVGSHHLSSSSSPHQRVTTHFLWPELFIISFFSLSFFLSHSLSLSLFCVSRAIITGTELVKHSA